MLRRDHRPLRTALGAAALTTLILGLAVPAVAADPTDDPTATQPTETPTPDDEPDPVELDDAVLRWGLNNESSNRAYAPRTYNFFSAGITPDPGKGGTTLSRSKWRQHQGEVAIEKWSRKRWRAATWSGLSTDSAGRPLGSPTAGTFSNHRFVFSGGTGEVDRSAGTAHLEWDGDVTVLYYSGMSTFHVSDPVLDVADGKGTITASVRGYASSLDDPSSWKPVPAATVTLADLTHVDLGSRGFTATPAYLGVTVSGLGQVTGDDHSGSFPQSFVNYMDRLGTAAFWLSSGAATDPYKVALPLTVGYDAATAPTDPTPTTPPTQAAIDNPAIPPPSTVTVTAPAGPAPAAPAAPAASATAPLAAVPPATVPAADVVPAALPAATQLVAATSQTPASAGTDSESGANAVWWLGGGLLLAAALTLLIPIGKAS